MNRYVVAIGTRYYRRGMGGVCRTVDFPKDATSFAVYEAALREAAKHGSGRVLSASRLPEKPVETQEELSF